MLRIVTVVVTPFQQNARLLIDPSEGQAVLVDPGGEVERILAHTPSEVSLISSILLTHAHIDHGGGVKTACRACEERFGERPKVLAYREDSGLRSSIADQARAFGLPAGEFQNVPEPDVFLEESAEIQVGSFTGRVLFTPGHSPDHLSVFFEAAPYGIEVFGPKDPYSSNAGSDGAAEQIEGNSPLLLAGDTLFAGSIGRTDLPGGDSRLLLRSIKEKILTLPDDTRVMPGHGPDTSVAVERRTNPFLREV